MDFYQNYAAMYRIISSSWLVVWNCPWWKAAFSIRISWEVIGIGIHVYYCFKLTLTNTPQSASTNNRKSQGFIWYDIWCLNQRWTNMCRHVFKCPFRHRCGCDSGYKIQVWLTLICAPSSIGSTTRSPWIWLWVFWVDKVRDQSYFAVDVRVFIGIWSIW